MRDYVFAKEISCPSVRQPSESEQKNCKFYKKSSFSDRCMHFMFEEYCDCLDAQIATQQPIQSDYIWI